jgi:hypothetical protein
VIFENDSILALFNAYTAKRGILRVEYNLRHAIQMPPSSMPIVTKLVAACLPPSVP